MARGPSAAYRSLTTTALYTDAGGLPCPEYPSYLLAADGSPAFGGLSVAAVGFFAAGVDSSQHQFPEVDFISASDHCANRPAAAIRRKPKRQRRVGHSLFEAERTLPRKP